LMSECLDDDGGGGGEWTCLLLDAFLLFDASLELHLARFDDDVDFAVQIANRKRQEVPLHVGVADLFLHLLDRALLFTREKKEMRR